MEINRVWKRRRACTAGKANAGWKGKERELQSELESWYCVFETLTHLLAHRALTHLNLLPRVFGEL